MKKLASLLLSGALALGLLAGCGGTPGTADTPAANTDTPAAPTQTGSLEGTTLKVGASPAPHAEILAVVKELLAEEGINLEIVEFTDYIQPNTAVENGDIDANYFQHITYLNNFNAENGTHLVSVADVHYEPFGIYARQDRQPGGAPGRRADRRAQRPHQRRPRPLCSSRSRASSL
ncbi:MAG: MetQ/NlpA family ABC transporter substrate-binding protein [Flavonifractor plautii]